eukprot:TRINITY_DN17823_c0_g1_i1.p2 TRINITY_DN17823_c0_g1~~TRINITY_DN17823_c0_g1_i1.p2  ORF type:complete len:106 (-),score=26.74 TRINITY_DN17823_c0_g1_i1:139-456(-)
MCIRDSNKARDNDRFTGYANSQSRDYSRPSPSVSRSPSYAKEDDNMMNAVFNSSLLDNLKGVKAELRYQQTLASISQTYHSSRQLLMGSDVVSYWAVLHLSLIHI